MILDPCHYSEQHMERCQYRDYASYRNKKYLEICTIVRTIYKYANIGIVIVYTIVGMIWKSVPLFRQHMGMLV